VSNRVIHVFQISIVNLTVVPIAYDDNTLPQLPVFFDSAAKRLGV